MSRGEGSLCPSYLAVHSKHLLAITSAATIFALAVATLRVFGPASDMTDSFQMEGTCGPTEKTNCNSASEICHPPGRRPFHDGFRID